MDKTNKKLIKKRAKLGLLIGPAETRRKYKIFCSSPELVEKRKKFRQLYWNDWHTLRHSIPYPRHCSRMGIFFVVFFALKMRIFRLFFSVFLDFLAKGKIKTAWHEKRYSIKSLWHTIPSPRPPILSPLWKTLNDMAQNP